MFDASNRFGFEPLTVLVSIVLEDRDRGSSNNSSAVEGKKVKVD